MYVRCVFSAPFRAAHDNYVYITMFNMDGLGLADYEHWGMSINSTHLVLDYSPTLKRSRLHEEASVARRFPSFGLDSGIARSLPIADLASKPSL